MGTAKTFTVHNYYTREIPIDDGLEGDQVLQGQTFPIRIRRFSVAQLQAFQRGYQRVVNPTADRFIFRRPEGDEQEMRDNGKGKNVHVIDDSEIRRRRLEEMTADQRTAFQQASDDDDIAVVAFCSAAIRDHIWLPPKVTVRVLIEDRDESGELVETEFVATNGDGLVTAFGGNLAMLVRLTSAIHEENTLAPEIKKALRLLSGSTASLPTLAAAVAIGGATQAATVTSAGTAASAASADVSAAPDLIPSGSIAT